VALSENTEKREKQLANLQKFEPGKSGNPGGRPKRKPFLEAIEKHIADHPEDVAAAIRQAFAKAKSGELPHLRELADRIDGPVTQKQEITGANGEPLAINIIVKDDKNS
jgi:hypothetical protein